MRWIVNEAGVVWVTRGLALHIQDDLRYLREAEWEFTELGLGCLAIKPFLKELCMSCVTSGQNVPRIVHTDVEPIWGNNMAFLLKLQVYRHPYWYA
jgi:hypothetical protein